MFDSRCSVFSLQTTDIVEFIVLRTTRTFSTSPIPSIIIIDHIASYVLGFSREHGSHGSCLEYSRVEVGEEAGSVEPAEEHELTLVRHCAVVGACGRRWPGHVELTPLATRQALGRPTAGEAAPTRRQPVLVQPSVLLLRVTPAVEQQAVLAR